MLTRNPKKARAQKVQKGAIYAKILWSTNCHCLVAKKKGLWDTSYVMRIWKQVCLEPRPVRTTDGKHTIVLYISDKKIGLNAKTRSGVVKALLRLGAQVFGACAPVNKLVIETIQALDGRSLSQSTIDQLKRQNKKYTPFRFSRDYQKIIKWLDFEHQGHRLNGATFRHTIDAKKI